MKKINLFFSILSCTILALTISFCNKEAKTASYPYEVRMTDAPGPYEAVYIDLKGIEITGGDGKMVAMNVHAGIYNLLNFTNGVDTLISTGTMENATVQQIRLILGANNSVVIGGISYPLSTPSADQSGLKLQVHQTLQAGVLYSVLLDFDANQSIVETGSGTYKLKPVIRTIVTANSGSIKGKITPLGTVAYITAFSSGNSFASNVTAAGDFMVMGLPAGTYSFTVTPVSPLIPVTKEDIVVTTGVTTNVGIIAF